MWIVRILDTPGVVFCNVDNVLLRQEVALSYFCHKQLCEASPSYHPDLRWHRMLESEKRRSMRLSLGFRLYSVDLYEKIK